MKNWPVYSPAARQAHREGVVLLNVRISAQGAPVEVKVARSSTFQDLDAAAAAAVRNWQFTPATQDGTPTETTVTLPINFSLKTAETPPAAAASSAGAKPQSAQTQDKPKPKAKVAQKPASKPKPEAAKPDSLPAKPAEPEEPAKETN
jgi:TonB family protein